jgi:signal transduction histidine kinase
VQGFEAGGVDYITKPFQYDEVFARVNAHLTIRKQQQQLQAQTAALQRMNAQLEALNASKDTFFSIIAHDLKSPFASHLVIANLIKENIEEWDKEKILHFADQLQESVDTLYAFIENLLTWARFQQGIMEYHPRNVNLQFIVARNVALLIQNAQQKQITLNNSIQEPIQISIDEHMIDAVIRNLVSNAIKFTHPGGTIEISATDNQNNVILAVADTGVGMTEKTRANLFQLDAKTRQVGTKGEHGTGLGLILCKEFIDQHGGNIRVESNVGQGSTFTVTLPKDR